MLETFLSAFPWQRLTISNILLYLSNISFCVTAVLFLTRLLLAVSLLPCCLSFYYLKNHKKYIHKFFIPPFRVVYITFVVTLTGLCHLIRETITW